jgi:hypothetical protein
MLAQEHFYYHWKRPASAFDSIAAFIPRASQYRIQLAKPLQGRQQQTSCCERPGDAHALALGIHVVKLACGLLVVKPASLGPAH